MLRGNKMSKQLKQKIRNKISKQLKEKMRNKMSQQLQQKMETKMPKQLKQRMEDILKALNENIHEREEVFSVSLLSALGDQNIFLYGPPGTAKSLISRRLAKVFKSEHYFEYLMQKFSTPEEVFGPISLTELKKDNYVRKTDGYLPTAEFVFLDEIWKSSPAILNTLLTALNEKKFRNGKDLLNLPLKVVVSASNETPGKGQGLEALYDRFLTRLYVPPMENKDNFEILLQNGGTSDEIDLDRNLLISNEEWKKWKKESNDIKLSRETLNIIKDIRWSIQNRNEWKKDFNIYISDRRWQKAGALLKTSAYFCERKETNIVDCLLLSHCLWNTKHNRLDIVEIVENAVRDSGFDTGDSLESIDEEKVNLELEIDAEINNDYTNERLKESLRNSITELSDKLQQIIKDTELKKSEFLKELDTPFILDNKIDIAIESVNKQIKELKIKHKDCQRLESLIG
jgi:MoxR-like ATPase